MKKRLLGYILIPGLLLSSPLRAFISPDPEGHVASMDLYSYCNGDPVNGYDPDGRFGKSIGNGFTDSSAGGLGLLGQNNYANFNSSPNAFGYSLGSSAGSILGTVNGAPGVVVGGGLWALDQGAHSVGETLGGPAGYGAIQTLPLLRLESFGISLAKSAVGGSEAESGSIRVTQYFDPKIGSFPIDGKFALSSDSTLGNRLIDGVTVPTTWVAPYAAGEMSLFRRLMTGVGNRLDYVEFDAIQAELANPSGLKSMFGGYQKVIPGRVNLTGRNAVFGTSQFNWLDAGTRYGVPLAGTAGGGFLIYKSNKQQ